MVLNLFAFVLSHLGPISTRCLWAPQRLLLQLPGASRVARGSPPRRRGQRGRLAPSTTAPRGERGESRDVETESLRKSEGGPVPMATDAWDDRVGKE